MSPSGSNTMGRLERILAIVGMIVCLGITIVIWWSVSAHQSMWLFPGFYFIELATLSVISAAMIVRGHPRASLVTWAAAGAVAAFVVLGAFSVGFFYMPVALILVATAALSDLRARQGVAGHLAVIALAAIVQTALMFLVFLVLPYVAA